MTASLPSPLNLTYFFVRSLLLLAFVSSGKPDREELVTIKRNFWPAPFSRKVLRCSEKRRAAKLSNFEFQLYFRMPPPPKACKNVLNYLWRCPRIWNSTLFNMEGLKWIGEFERSFVGEGAVTMQNEWFQTVSGTYVSVHWCILGVSCISINCQAWYDDDTFIALSVVYFECH